VLRKYVEAAFAIGLGLLPACAFSQGIAAAVPTAVTDQNRTGPMPYTASMGTGVENVDLSTGNLSIRIPLVHVNSRGKDYDITLQYDGNYWSPLSIPNNDSSEWANETRTYIPGLTGWSLSQPYITYAESSPTFLCSGPGGALPSGNGGTKPPTAAMSTGQAYQNYIFVDDQGRKNPLNFNHATVLCPSGVSGNITYANSGPDTNAQGIWATYRAQIPDDGNSYLQNDADYVLTADGTAYTPGGSAPNDLTIASHGYGMGTITDVNSNTEQLYPGGLDTIGRTPLTLTQDNADQFHYTYYDPNGNAQEIIVHLETVNISTDFGVDSTTGYPIFEASGAIQTIQSIDLPNGTSYSFSYENNSYGGLTNITLPDGGSVSYQYSTLQYFDWTHRYVSQRTTNDGVSQATWNLSIANTTGALPGASPAQPPGFYATVSTLTDPTPQQNQSIYSQSSGFTYDVQLYSGAATGTALRHYQISYFGYAPVAAFGEPFNPGLFPGLIPSQIVTTNDAGQVSEIQYDYDTFTYPWSDCGSSGPSFSCLEDGLVSQTVSATRGNVTGIREYDWGNGAPGPLLRQTLKTYLYNQNSGYVTANVVDRVASDSVYDGSQVCFGGQTCSANLISQTTYSYDQDGAGFRGRPTEVSKWLNTTGTLLNTTYTYDTYGNITSITDPKGNTSKWTYVDSWAPNNGNCVPAQNQSSYVTAATNALNQTTSYTYAPCTGQPVTKRDPNDTAANRNGLQVAYDLMKRITGVVSADGGNTTTVYNDQAHTVETETLMTGTTQIDKLTILDGLGRTKETELLSDPEGADVVTTTYDAMGRTLCVSNPYRGTPSGAVCTAYDPLSRPTVVTEQDGSSTTSSYTGNETTSTDESGYTWERYTDGLNRLEEVIECGLACSSTNLTTTYTYDPLGDLRSVTQSGTTGDTPRLRSFIYDSLARLLTAANPETGSVAYNYLANGAMCAGDPSLPCSKTDARGVTTSYGYDALNRLTSKTYSGVTGAVAATQPSTFIYDSSTNGVAVLNPIGRLVEEYTGPSSAPNTERFILGYDAMGRITQEQQCGAISVCGASPYNFQYMYDLAGDVISSTNGVSSTGIGLTYAYDGAGRLQTLTSSWNDATHPATLFSPPASGAQYSAVGLVGASLGTFSSSQSPVYTLQRAYDSRLRPISETDVATASVLHPATVSAGSIAIAGAVQQTTGASTPATGTITITGTEGSHQVCTIEPPPAPIDGRPGPLPPPKCVTVADTGVLSVTVDGFTATVSYASGSTDQTIVTALANALNATGSPVSAAGSSNVLTMTSIATGTAANYPLSLSNGADFSGTDSGAALSGGAAGPVIDDAGSVSVTVNGSTITVPWQEGSTAQSIATNLVSALQSADGSLLTVSLSGTTVLLASKQTGTAANMAISTSVAYNSTTFKSASFSATASGLTGGANAAEGPSTIYSYSVPAGGYAPNGNLLTVNDSVTGDWAYTYDGLNRLLAAQANANTQTGFAPYGGALLNWSYDSFGNNKGETLSGTTTLSIPQVTHTYTGKSLLNGVAQSGVVTNRMDGYNYDASGDLLSDNISSSYTYDAEGRVASVDGTTQYVYDAEGRRVAKLNGTTVTNLYLLGLGGEQVSEINNSTGTLAWAHSNVYAAGKLLATYTPSGLHYQFSDWLGTRRVQSLVQASGAETVEETCQSLPYGDALTCSGADATEQHYTGKERDSESGLDYFGARYYASSMGRWMSPDKPFVDQHPANPQSWNIYAYARNNPLRFVDDDGEVVVETRTVQYTTVSGSNASEALDHANTSITGDRAGNTASSLSWHVDSSWNSSPAAGGNVSVTSTVTSDTITLNQTVTLPMWDGYDKASPADQKSWDSAVGQLKDHETQHEDINRAGADALDKSLPGTQASATGAKLDPTVKSSQNNLNGAVQQKVDTSQAQTNQKQQKLDQDTDHGRKPPQ
jgi:RHS repeat-associated protein